MPDLACSADSLNISGLTLDSASSDAISLIPSISEVSGCVGVGRLVTIGLDVGVIVGATVEVGPIVAVGCGAAVGVFVGAEVGLGVGVIDGVGVWVGPMIAIVTSLDQVDAELQLGV